jgi:hypothetical protein
MSDRVKPPLLRGLWPLCRTYAGVRDFPSISYAVTRIFASNGSYEPVRRSKMAHYLISNDKCPGLAYGDEGELQPSGYRFGREVKYGHVKYGVGRSALHRVGGYLRTLIEVIGNAKLRRMRRELELRGIRLDQSDEVWIASSLREDNRSA